MTNWAAGQSDQGYGSDLPWSASDHGRQISFNLGTVTTQDTPVDDTIALNPAHYLCPERT